MEAVHTAEVELLLGMLVDQRFGATLEELIGGWSVVPQIA